MRTSREITIYEQIITAADYVGSYIFRWADSKDKSTSIESYSEGDEIETVSDARVNQLSFDDTPSYISDKLCVSMTLWDTAARSDAARVLAKVWYDEDNDQQLDSGEVTLSFSTIITEK